ncbi:MULTISPECIES: tRNA1(Val) (adenine(37)-N6)-methyltransferase [Pseudidiomarina]|uniref:tRNA1(Val) (adenine(37)-N6)-methyltransferase n=2 Tax=Pseudidiomarina TaxID=2800384 RepID=A0A432YD30_9GAMM|nr:MULTISPECIES: methyltransferase [Pseudidiomarina]MDS0219574.1 methyltransferase [Pseudidiomarina andamanensis]QGT95797.1 methyltransferase domain-containing protein [Pseudidiomarina andamanensis]RUO58841.1 tRNA (adenosine(37)-N6)-methyltransferase TrmM [Pseudidiomarina marina]
MGFQCRQFYLKDDQCAMKVSTDSLLFGAWVEVDMAQRILDMGTGCGILALMLAQRSTASAKIEAIELDARAAIQAQQNALASPWPDKIMITQGDVTTAAYRENQYDLIVMNPPYFANHLASASKERELARQGTGDVWRVWLQRAAQLLAPNGRIAVVAPIQAQDTIVSELAAMNLQLARQYKVQSTPKKAPYLILLEFISASKAESTKFEKLVIRDEAGQYTAGFKQITRDFYLNFE